MRVLPNLPRIAGDASSPLTGDIHCCARGERFRGLIICDDTRTEQAFGQTMRRHSSQTRKSPVSEALSMIAYYYLQRMRPLLGSPTDGC
jgi:hypothetical protein